MAGGLSNAVAGGGGGGGGGGGWGDDSLVAGTASGTGGYSIETIRVSPEQLNTAAGQVTAKISNAKNHFDSISQLAENTAGFWSGDAGDKYRKLFVERKPEMEEIFARFREHASDLQTLAANYISKETEIKSLVEESLPTDAII